MSGHDRWWFLGGFLTVLGGLASGWSGLLASAGLFALAIGIIAVLRGHLAWARLPHRRAGVAMVAGALVLMGFSGALAPEEPDAAVAGTTRAQVAISQQASPSLTTEPATASPSPSPTLTQTQALRQGLLAEVPAKSPTVAKVPVVKVPTAKPTPVKAPIKRPKPAPVAPADDPPASVYYARCADARAAGAAPLHRGDPGYRPGLDRDGDGVACE